jgi:hypothetical protein
MILRLIELSELFLEFEDNAEKLELKHYTKSTRIFT